MKRLLMILMISLMVLAGCQQGDGNSGGSADTPFIGGTEGLIMSFSDGAPPDEVFDGGTFPFDIVVQLKNQGETTIAAEDATVSISGIDPNVWGGVDLTQQPSTDLVARKKLPEGSIVESPTVPVEFLDLRYQDQLLGNKQFKIRADVCYLYETRAVSEVCLLRDPFGFFSDEDKVCSIQESKDVDSSSAPLQVQNFKETLRGEEKIAFQFDVVHRGNGEIFKRSTQCDESVHSNEDRVWVDVEVVNSPTVRCSGLREGDDTSGFINLFGGDGAISSRTVTCTVESAPESDYVTPVNIKLQYDYEEDITTDILVKHSPDE